MTSSVQPTVPPSRPPERGEGDTQPRTLRLEVASGSDQGRARSYNEDAIQVTPPELPPPPRGYLYLVADGMGGHNAGEVASAGAVQRIYPGYYEDTEPDVHRSLDKVIRRANAELYAQAQANPAQHGMGTTLTALVILGDRGYQAHVGDSRLYRVRGGKPEQLTRDHSWVAEQVRAGVLTPEQAEVHPQRNVITRALASAPDVQVDHAVVELQAGDVLVLCSDGLNTKVGDAQIAALATKSATAQEAVQRLITLANQNGGEDNISVAVIRVVAEGSGVMPAVMAEGVTEKVPVVPGDRPARGLPWLVLGVLAVVLLLGGGLAGYFVLIRREPSTPAVAPGSATPGGNLPTGTGPVPTSTLELTSQVVGVTTELQASLAAGTPAVPTDASGGMALAPTATLAPSPTPGPGPSPAASGASGNGPTQVAKPTSEPRRVTGPVLGDPANGASETGPSVRFSWTTAGRALQPGEAYAPLVWRAGDPKVDGCRGLACPAAFDACKDPWTSSVWAIQDFEKGPGKAGPGDYLWTVVIVDTTEPDPADPSRCLVISDQPPSHRFTYVVPGGGGGGEPLPAPP